MNSISEDDVVAGLDALARFLRYGNEHFIPDLYFDEDDELVCPKPFTLFGGGEVQ